MRQPGALSSVEITPAMIDAGVKAIQDSGRLNFESDGLDRTLVEDLLFRVFAAGGMPKTNARQI